MITSSLEVRFILNGMDKPQLRPFLGGTAGNVLANRLTEDRNAQVLVLDAGGR